MSLRLITVIVQSDLHLCLYALISLYSVSKRKRAVVVDCSEIVDISYTVLDL